MGWVVDGVGSRGSGVELGGDGSAEVGGGGGGVGVCCRPQYECGVLILGIGVDVGGVSGGVWCWCWCWCRCWCRCW